MSERRRKASTKNRTVAYIAAGVVHAVIIAAMLINFTSKHETVDAAFAEKVDVVKATTIDESQIKQQQDKLKKQERDKQRKKEQERKRLENLKKQSEQEKKRIEELKKQQKLEKEKATELEKQRKEIALKKKKEEEKRKKDDAERKEKEAERKKKAEDARKKKEAEKKRKEKLERIKREEQALETQRRLNESLAAEEAFLAEQRAKQRATTLRSKYSALIKQKVNAVRTVSPNFERWRTTKVNVKLSPSGDVKVVRVVKSSGNVQYDRSVETAIRKASPLPIPSVADDAEVNKLFQDLNLSFDMSEL